MSVAASLDPEPLLRRARALAEASAADETEVTVESVAEGFARFADRGPTQAADRERLIVAVRARFAAPGGGYSEARARFVGGDPEGWTSALERATALARVAPVDEEAPALGGSVQVLERTADSRTVHHAFSAKSAWIQEACRRCEEHGLRPAGMIQTGGRARVLVNSAGRAVAGSTSQASLSLTASGDSGAGIGSVHRSSVEDLDTAAAIERAVDKARRSQDPRELPPGDYPVVLEPLAVASALLFASYRGFGAREVAEGESFLCGREGQRVLASELSIRDDHAHLLAPGLPFDGEGSPRQIVSLVEDGVLRDPVTDTRYAAKLGLPCSGHAGAQPSSSGPKPEHLVVESGAADRRALLRSIDRGLLVSQLHYTNLIDPRDLKLTGMTRNGTFWVEDGEIRHAVHDLRFTDSLVRFLGAIAAVGDTPEVAGALFDGQVVTPALALPSLRFTSGTKS